MGALDPVARDGLERRENTELRRASFALGKVQQDGARSFSNLDLPDMYFCDSQNSLSISIFVLVQKLTSYWASIAR